MKKIIILFILMSFPAHAGSKYWLELLWGTNNAIVRKSCAPKLHNSSRSFSRKKIHYNNFEEAELRIKIRTDDSYQFSPMLNTVIEPPEVILLDYDNTLVDSWPQDFRTSSEALMVLGLPLMSPREMLSQPHIPATYALAALAKKPIEEIEEIYYPIYHKHHKEPAPLVPGALQLISSLKEKGVYVSIISNKEHSLLENTIETIGLKNYFNNIIGARANKPHKPSPDIIEEAIKGIHVKDRKNIWLVGDAFSSDILCAMEGNVTPVWISKYSVDQLNFSEGGIPIIHALDCFHLKEIIEGSQRNSLIE